MAKWILVRLAKTQTKWTPHTTLYVKSEQEAMFFWNNLLFLVDDGKKDGFGGVSTAA